MAMTHPVIIYGLGLLVLLIVGWTSLRLAILTVLFLISLLNVFHAPTSIFWLVAIIASEYSVIFATITTCALLAGFYTVSCNLVGTIIGVLALFLFLSPIIRAYLIARDLPADLKKAFKWNKTFNEQPLTTAAFSFKKLFQTVPKIPFRTFTYVTYDDTTLTLDFYNSSVAGNRPCVVVIHGGGWSTGNSKQLPELNSHLARIAYHVAAINYRLVPKWTSPAPKEDVAAALNYLRANADQLNVDKNNFVLLGRSAGGQVALLSAYTLRDLGIKGVVDFYGPVDMVWGYQVRANPLIMDSQTTLVRYLGGHYSDIPDKYAASSSIEFVNKQTVPPLIIHGKTDPLVFIEHGARLDAKLEQNNILHYFLRLPWATHGFDYHLNGPGGQLSTYAIEQFLYMITSH